MTKVKVYLDCEGNTLTVWFGDPAREHVCEEVENDVVLMKDRRGRVIGFERLNYVTAKQRHDAHPIPVEIQMAGIIQRRPQEPPRCLFPDISRI